MTEHDTTPSKVPATSWEATAAPERGLEDLPLEQVTVVLQTSGRRLGRMARWAEESIHESTTMPGGKGQLPAAATSAIPSG